jgi:hypothetical protein
VPVDAEGFLLKRPYFGTPWKCQAAAIAPQQTKKLE